MLQQTCISAEISSLFMAREVFYLILSPEMSDIILQETNRKSRVCDVFNNPVAQRYPNASQQPPQKC